MATNQLLQLEEIQMDYHSFRKDQVLTEKHLNELIRYFEDQDRLTRTCLTGVGLVCGLNVQFDKQGGSITISKGCSVTTDGDLLVSGATVYRHFKTYSNRKKGTNDPIYDPFFPPPNGAQIDLWELVLPDANGNLPQDSRGLVEFNTLLRREIDDLVVLQYLEYYLQDPDKCSVIDCDNQGEHQQSQIKILLLSKSDMDKIINRDPVNEIIYDSIYKKYNDSKVQYYNLPLLKARRVILNGSNTLSISALAKAYTGIVQTGGNKLIDAVDSLYTAFRFMIDPGTTTNILQVKQSLQQNLSTAPKVFQAQYLYDYYKDIITCYNELRDWVFRCMYECCPDKYAFPKHIMLGELTPSGTEPPPYRHDFYPSPAVTNNKEKLARSRSLWLRMVQMVQQFAVPAQISEVKVTPSTDYDQPVENRAIPFYYKDVSIIVKNWNYALSRRGAEKSVLSYHAGSYAQGIDSSLFPLDFEIDSNNFYRIEGHLGKTLTISMQLVNDIKNTKSLAFDTMAIRLDKAGNLSDINPEDYDCVFEDLNAILKAWLVEQNCLYGSVTKFFTGFTTSKDAGFHAKIEDFKLTTLPQVGGIGATRFARMFSAQPATIATREEPGITTVETGIETTKMPFSRTIRFVDTTIVNNLDTSKSGTLGNQFFDTLNLSLDSADETIAEMKRRTALDPNLPALTPEEKEIVYEIPITLVAYINQISSLKPTQVTEINSDLITKYMGRTDQLCKYVRLVNSRVDSIFNMDAYQKRGYEGYYSFLLRQLIANCCAAERLQTFLDEIDSRKKKILESLQLANYANKHPGLEHKAGVHRGGTFVLVYAKQQKIGRSTGLSDREINNLITGDFSVEETSDSVRRKETGKSAAVYKDLDSFAYYLVTNQGDVDFNKELQVFMKVQGIQPGSLEEEQVTRRLIKRISEMEARLNKDTDAAVADNIVIADFCLPYLCCSDCPPMTFIVPKQNFNLSLPKGAACSDERPLEFHKEPVDGIVKAVAGFENTVTNVNARSFFDPSKVSAASFGKEIHFTINDQVTDCQITVFKHPTAKFEFRVEREDDATIVAVFTNSSDDDTGTTYIYEWNFNNGQPAQRVDNKQPITVTYKKAFLESIGLAGMIPVTLVAINGPCKSEVVTLNVPYNRDQPVSLSLPAEIVCNDANPINFNVQPANGTIASPEEPNSVVNTNNVFQFDPRLVRKFRTPITFTVNGKPTNCKITVFRHPKASFGIQQAPVPGTQDIKVTLTNTTDPQNDQQLTYTWSYNLGNPDTTNDTRPFDKIFNIQSLRRLNQTDIVITLRAANTACSDTIEQKIPLPVVAQPGCADVVAGNIDAGIQSLSTAEIARLMLRITPTPEGREVVALLKDVLALLGLAKAGQARLNDAAFQLQLINQAKALLLKIYGNQFSDAVNTTVMTPAAIALLKLALDISRCQPQLNGQVKEILQSIITDFNQNLRVIVRRMPTLNANKTLSDFVKGYIEAAQHRDTQILDGAKALARLIETSF